MVPRENKNNVYAKCGGTNKDYYGIFRSGLFKYMTFMYLHIGRILTTAVVRLTFLKVGCLQTSLSDLKIIRVFTGKIK